MKSLRWSLPMFAVLAAGAPFSLPAQQKGKKPPIREPLPYNAVSNPQFQRRATDVMATVEGRKITRRELTYFLLQADARAVGRLGEAMAARWKANQGASSAYALSDIEIYAALYGDEKDPTLGQTLGNLVINRLMDTLATRQKIRITPAQIRSRARVLFDDARKRLNIKASDEEIMRMYNVPRDVFFADQRFRLQAELLFKNDFARRNGHPIRPDDWAQVRALFVAVDSSAKEAFEASESAKKRLEGWVKEIKDGKPMEMVAQRNEDNSNGGDGLRPLLLRGAEEKRVDEAVFRYRPGDFTPPVRVEKGWTVFRIEKRGDQIPQEEREAAWSQLVSQRLDAFLTGLARQAKITSRLPLPFQQRNAGKPNLPLPGTNSRR